jgi:hypothetical protein
LVDKEPATDTIELTGVVSITKAPSDFSGLWFLWRVALAKYFRVHDVTARWIYY